MVHLVHKRGKYPVNVETEEGVGNSPWEVGDHVQENFTEEMCLQNQVSSRRLLLRVDSRHSAIKRNETGSFVETLIDPESVIQSEVSQ